MQMLTGWNAAYVICETQQRATPKKVRLPVRQMPDKVTHMCCYASQATQK